MTKNHRNPPVSGARPVNAELTDRLLSAVDWGAVEARNRHRVAAIYGGPTPPDFATGGPQPPAADDPGPCPSEDLLRSEKIGAELDQPAMGSGEGEMFACPRCDGAGEDYSRETGYPMGLCDVCSGVGEVDRDECEAYFERMDAP